MEDDRTWLGTDVRRVRKKRENWRLPIHVPAPEESDLMLLAISIPETQDQAVGQGNETPSPPLVLEPPPEMTQAGSMHGPLVSHVWANTMAHFGANAEAQAANRESRYHCYGTVRQPPGFKIAPTMSEAGANILAQGVNTLVELKKRKEELHRRVNNLALLLVHVDEHFISNVREVHIKDRVQEFYEITKIIRQMMSIWCTPSCDYIIPWIHKNFSLVDFAFQKFQEKDWVLDTDDFDRTMRNTCSKLFRFILHIYVDHNKELLRASRETYLDLVTTYKLLYTFTKQWDLRIDSERQWLENWFKNMPG